MARHGDEPFPSPADATDTYMTGAMEDQGRAQKAERVIYSEITGEFGRWSDSPYCTTMYNWVG